MARTGVATETATETASETETDASAAAVGVASVGAVEVVVGNAAAAETGDGRKTETVTATATAAGNENERKTEVEMTAMAGLVGQADPARSGVGATSTAAPKAACFLRRRRSAGVTSRLATMQALLVPMRTCVVAAQSRRTTVTAAERRKEFHSLAMKTRRRERSDCARSADVDVRR